MLRLPLLPLVWLACAWSWLTYFGARPADKEVYWRHAWGWLSPEMEPHWTMLLDSSAPGRGSAFHELKNIGAEYCRAWPQTAAKSWAFLSVAALVLSNLATSIIVWLA
jgi:hypothetical protein